MATALFIDIRESEVETYLFDSRRGTCELKEKKTHPLSGNCDFSLDPVPGTLENTYVSLPLSSLNFRVLTLPFVQKDKVREVLPFELDGIILGGSEKVVFDTVPLGNAGNSSEILAVYTEKQIIGELLRKLKTYNADPVCVTSLELRKALQGFSSEKLLTPSPLEDQERISLAVEEIKTPTINLRRDEFTYTREIEQTKKSLRWTAILVLLVALLISADLLLNIFSVRSEITAARNDIRKRYQEAFPGEKNIINELHQMKSHIKELKTDEELYVGISPLATILKISDLDRQGVVFHELSIDRENMSFKGEASSLTDVQKMKDRMDALFEGVAISDSKSSAQGSLLFTITAGEKKS
jgi:type II secretory pathway component PulL